MRVPIIKKRRSRDHLIFIMEVPILASATNLRTRCIENMPSNAYSNLCSWNTNILVSWFLAVGSIMTQFWQASIIYKCRWWIWVWNIFTCHLTYRCISTLQECFLWPSGVHINQSGCAVTGKQRVLYRGPHQCRICPASLVIKHGCIPSGSIWDDYYWCSCWIIF